MAIKTDEDAWHAYPHHRKWFNKLWLSEYFDYYCGPSGTTPEKSTNYIVKPIYNLSGMGAGAKIRYLTRLTKKSIPPGHFWCEKFSGNETSITYRYKKDSFEIDTIYRPSRENKSILYKYSSWTKLKTTTCELPEYFHMAFSDVPVLNVEFVGSNVIEIHFRDTPDPKYNHIIPIWNTTDNELIINKMSKGYKFIADCDDADGHLPETRIGFLVKD